MRSVCDCLKFLLLIPGTNTIDWWITISCGKLKQKQIHFHEAICILALATIKRAHQIHLCREKSVN